MVKHLLEVHRRGRHGYVKKRPEESSGVPTHSNKRRREAEPALEKENLNLYGEIEKHATVQKETAVEHYVKKAMKAAAVVEHKRLKAEVARLKTEALVHSALLEENRLLKNEVEEFKKILEIIRGAVSIGDSFR